ncbi:MAG: hypothetical protein JWN14_2253 [Chthonomonadales bacterium]|nr:hypothetical protein [Chthonomonadales bacterium]
MSRRQLMELLGGCIFAFVFVVVFIAIVEFVEHPGFLRVR